MAGALDIAVSGMIAGTRRLEASASNVANVRAKGALPDAAGNVPQGGKEAYRPLDVGQTALRSGDQPAGVRATFTPINPPFLPENDPDHAQADANGVVAAPNVDLARERVNQIAAGRAYAANVAVARTEDEMLREAIDAKV